MFSARHAPNAAPPLATTAEEEEDDDFVLISSPGDQDGLLPGAPATSEPAPPLGAAAAAALGAPAAGAATARVLRSTHRGRGGVRGDFAMEAEVQINKQGAGKTYDARCPGWFH
jgi:hypothetical protein|mmetsp:Transcript_24956/g.59527  ORF Transcript_24956/g.59527 Transcript_24956/m.59527 type:complete len:114 (-) Transcript_24956:579-920(-)